MKIRKFGRTKIWTNSKNQAVVKLEIRKFGKSKIQTFGGSKIFMDFMRSKLGTFNPNLRGQKLQNLNIWIFEISRIEYLYVCKFLLASSLSLRYLRRITIFFTRFRPTFHIIPFFLPRFPRSQISKVPRSQFPVPKNNNTYINCRIPSVTNQSFPTTRWTSPSLCTLQFPPAYRLGPYTRIVIATVKRSMLSSSAAFNLNTRARCYTQTCARGRNRRARVTVDLFRVTRHCKVGEYILIFHFLRLKPRALRLGESRYSPYRILPRCSANDDDGQGSFQARRLLTESHEAPITRIGDS